MTAQTRWPGYCHGCRRDNVEVESRYDQAAKTLCDECAARARSANPDRAAVRAVVDVPGPGPGPGPGQELPLMRQLLELYDAREIPDDELGPWRLGPLSDYTTTEPMRRIAQDIDLRVRLLLTEGITRALPYALSEAVNARFVRLKGSASYALARLVAERVICCIGEMRPLGKGNGTRLYVPPLWRPADPEALAVAIELSDGNRLADVVWIPDEPRDTARARAVQPDAEVVDELIIGDAAGTLHSSESPTASGAFGPHASERLERIHAAEDRSAGGDER